jgi:hypothetical protein
MPANFGGLQDAAAVDVEIATTIRASTISTIDL